MKNAIKRLLCSLGLKSDDDSLYEENELYFDYLRSLNKVQSKRLRQKYGVIK